jgi:hypothetical protein
MVYGLRARRLGGYWLRGMGANGYMAIGYWLVIIGYMDINYVIIGYGY